LQFWADSRGKEERKKEEEERRKRKMSSNGRARYDIDEEMEKELFGDWGDNQDHEEEEGEDLFDDGLLTKYTPPCPPTPLCRYSLHLSPFSFLIPEL
jgi:hypothetical protein